MKILTNDGKCPECGREGGCPTAVEMWRDTQSDALYDVTYPSCTGNPVAAGYQGNASYNNDEYLSKTVVHHIG